MSTTDQIADGDRLLTIEEFAESLRMSTSTVRRRLRDGSLRGYRAGGRILIPLRERARFLAGQTYAGDPEPRSAIPMDLYDTIARAARVRESANNVLSLRRTGGV